MFDTINLQIPPELLPQDYYNQHKHLLTNEETKINNRGETGSGYFKNIFLKHNNDGLFIYGSLSRYYLGTNQKNLRQRDILPAFTQLAEDLDLPIFQAKVNRVDLADNLILKNQVESYYPYLGDTKYFRRSEFDRNVYYKGKGRIILIYNKVRDVKTKRREKLVPLFVNQNVKRFEYRFSNHRALANFFGLTTVTVEDLILCYPDLVADFYKTFDSINKRRDVIHFDAKVFDEKGLFDKQVRIMGVETLGGLDAVKDLIKLASKSGQFKYPNQPSYLISRYTELMSSPKLTVISPLVTEMETKMRISRFVNQDRSQIIYQ